MSIIAQQTYENKIIEADKTIKSLKQDRKGFWNFFNGYRNYCNSRIAIWREFKIYCVDKKTKQKR